MKTNWTKVLLGAALITALATGRFILYSKSPRNVLDNSDQFILYSLQPHTQQGDTRVRGLFHRSGILGQATITDPQLRSKLVDALFTNIPNDGSDASCFNPRHGIRATHNGRTVDAEICFECGAIYFWENNKSEKQLVSQQPQKIFDQALSAANLPLAEKPH